MDTWRDDTATNDMGRNNIRVVVYLDRELADTVENQDEPDSEFIRYAIRQELQRREAIET